MADREERVWTVEVPCRVYDDEGNYAPKSGERRIDEPRWMMTYRVWADTAEEAVRVVGDRLGRIG